jgi:hypothetical protein
MKTTNRHLITLAKAVFVAVLISISAGNVCSQKSMKAHLPYKPDFIKQMIYQLSYDYMVPKGATITLTDYKVMKPYVKQGAWREKNGRSRFGKASKAHSSNVAVNSNDLEACLVQASHLKDKVEVLEDTRVERDSNGSELEQFLTSAAHLNNRVEIEMEVVCTGNTSEVDQLEEYLVRASHLKDRVNGNESTLTAGMMAYSR